LTSVIVLGGYLSYHYHQLSMQDRVRVDRAYEVLYRVDALFVSVEDADVSEGEFLLTGRTSDLAAYYATVRSVGSGVQQLMPLLSDSPTQQQQLRELSEAIVHRLNDLRRTIVIRQTSGFEATRLVVERGDQRSSMDLVRACAAALVSTERRLLEQRQDIGRQRERDVLLIGLLIAALSVSTRIAIAWTLAIVRRRAKRAVTGF
jgi:methyl-accepting chemotaxis protein